MSECVQCGGQYDSRYVDIPCPLCGRQYKASPTINNIKLNTEVIEKAKGIDIPSQYQGHYWNVDRLIKEYHNLQGDLNFKRYYTQLQKVHEIFEKGLLPSKSMLAVAPPRMSKVTWAYSCMQQALAHNYSVNPLLDTVEVSRLIKLAGENVKYKLYDKISYDDFMMADVCFITVSKTESRFNAFSTILEVLDNRSRKGLATFIISRFDIAQLSRFDYLGHFKAIEDPNGRDNDLKYPVLVQFRDFIGKEK